MPPSPGFEYVPLQPVFKYTKDVGWGGLHRTLSIRIPFWGGEFPHYIRISFSHPSRQGRRIGWNKDPSGK